MNVIADIERGKLPPIPQINATADESMQTYAEQNKEAIVLT